MADTDPPDEVDDGESPADRDVDAPDADALDKQPCRAGQQALHDPECDEKTEDPSQRGLAFENDAADFVRNRRKAVPFVDYRSDVYRIWKLYRLCHVSFLSAPDWGCGFPSDVW